MHFDVNRHPATLLPLLPQDQQDGPKQCGSCAHMYERPGNHGVRLKCRRRASRTRPGPNLQPVFPACEGYEPPKASAGTPA